MILPLIASCHAGIAPDAIARPRVGTGDICRDHNGVTEMDVFGNEMYVRCSDGTILTK